MRATPIVCAKCVDDFFIINRSQSKYVFGKIKKSDFEKIMSWCSQNPNDQIPDWLEQGLCSVGYNSENLPTKDIITFRTPSKQRFGQATFEATWLCNYSCPFCILGQKTNKNVPMQRFLSTTKKKEILDIIALSGALFLQITGGEIFTMKDFVEIYEHAYQLGFVINLSTNGSLLTLRRDVQQILSELPPNRITLSMYGATEASYHKTTSTSDTFRNFIKSLEWLKHAQLTTRINGIVVASNVDEKTAMRSLAEQQFGFEYFEYNQLTPSIDGKPVNLVYGVPSTYNDSGPPKEAFTGCEAGITFFNVDPFGNATACKIARQEHVVNLFKERENAFAILPTFNKKIMEMDIGCMSCRTKHCGMCPPKIKLFGNNIPCNL